MPKKPVTVFEAGVKDRLGRDVGFVLDPDGGFITIYQVVRTKLDDRPGWEAVAASTVDSPVAGKCIAALVCIISDMDEQLGNEKSSVFSPCSVAS